MRSGARSGARRLEARRSRARLRRPSLPGGKDRMDARRLTGLSSVEAARRLETVGPNEIGGGGGRPLWRIVQETLREPMFLLLIGAAVLYLFLGDLGEG